MYYNRYGEPVTLWEWVAENEHGKVLRQTFIRQYLVSTIYTGLDFSVSAGRPHIFETMIFDMNGGDYNLNTWHHSSLSIAHLNHWYIVRWLMEVHHTDESEIRLEIDGRPALTGPPTLKLTIQDSNLEPAH